MDLEERHIHLIAGAAYGRDATCGPADKPKQDYKSEETAVKSAVLMSEKFGKKMEGYPCFWCKGWHIGRAMTEEERLRFSD